MKSDDAFRCPRCGYDQSGVVSTWVTACPTHLCCAECGLNIDLGQLHRDGLDPMDWWVERTRRRRRLPLTTMWSLVLAHVPWWLFRRVRMTHPPRFRRLLLTYLAMAVLAYVTLVIVATVYAFDAIALSLRSLDDLVVAVVSLVFPWLPTQSAQTPLRVDIRNAWSSAGQEAMPVLFGSLVLTVVTFVACATFLVLPITRKRAKVRWAHLFRAAIIISWTAPAQVGATIVWFDWISELYRAQMQRMTQTVWWFDLVALVPIWLISVLCWHAVGRLHLRMDHAWAVAASVTTVGMLGTLALMFVVGAIISAFV